MQQLNLGLASYGLALAVHRLGDSIAISWILVGFTLAIAAIIFLKIENSDNTAAIDNQLNLLLAFVLSLFGGVMAWL